MLEQINMFDLLDSIKPNKETLRSGTTYYTCLCGIVCGIYREGRFFKKQNQCNGCGRRMDWREVE